MAMACMPFRDFHGIPRKHNIVQVSKETLKCIRQIQAARTESKNVAEQGGIKWNVI